MPPTFTHEGAVAALELRASRPGARHPAALPGRRDAFRRAPLERHADRFGYLLKDRVVHVSTLLQALDTVAAGGTVLDPDIVRSLMQAHARRSPLAALSDRERDVLALMAEGMSNAAIATRLSSRSRRSRATSRTSSASSACTTSPTRTAGCSPS